MSIVTTFADKLRLTVPNVPEPMKLLLVRVRLQLVFEQNPAAAGRGIKLHRPPATANAIEAHVANAALGKIFRISVHAD
jgi:hypothetical protein